MTAPAMHRLCSLRQLRANRRLTCWVDELRDEITALFLGDELLVFSSVCPHFGGELDFSCVASGQATCKWHAWRFDLREGRCLSHRLPTRLRHYQFVADEPTDTLYVRAE
jgi:nitrite reductase/ring-hydroxylating ferredoxin subunit